MSRNAVFVWDFTLKEDGVDLEHLKATLDTYCKSWVFQLEEGESGYRHYQGRVSLCKRARKGFNYPNIHWSPTCTKNMNDSRYVEKLETRIDGPWRHDDEYIPPEMINVTLKPWQQDVLDDIVFAPRIVNVLVCPKGNIGKSFLCEYADINGLAIDIDPQESQLGYMRQIFGRPKGKLYLVDFPRRSNVNSCNHVGFWNAMEMLKNGKAYDDRYMYRRKRFPKPNVWVFTNEMPDTYILSEDRWVLWKVVNDKLVKINSDGQPLGNPGPPVEDVMPFYSEVEDMGYDSESGDEGPSSPPPPPKALTRKKIIIKKRPAAHDN